MVSFILRWVFAFVLVAATYNPTQWNYVRWANDNFQEQLPLVVLFGLILFVFYVVYVSATWRAIGAFGMLLVLAIVGTLLWFLYDRGILSLENGSLNTWIGLFTLSVILGIGMTWSLVWRRISGQLKVDETDT